MSTGRQYKQRNVPRAHNKPRYMKQRMIRRGGNPAYVPPSSNIVGLTSFTPQSMVLGTPGTLTLTGTKFQTGTYPVVGIIFKMDPPETASVVALTFTVVDDTTITVPIDFAGNGPDQVMGYSISVGDGHTGSNYVGGFVIAGA